MARTGFCHWVGVLFIFAAFILLLITTISAPVINDISILHVTLTNSSDLRHSSVNFGTFGYCVLDAAPASSDQDYCTGKIVGYRPAFEMAQADGTQFSQAASATADGLTNTMVLHPIACAVAFIAFLLSAGAGVIGSLFGFLVAALAWVLTLVAMAIDFTLFGIVKNNVNSSGRGATAEFGVAMWTILAAMILLFFGAFTVLFTCCSARRQRKRDTVIAKNDYGTQTRRSRWSRWRR